MVNDSACRLLVNEEVLENFDTVAMEFSKENLELINTPTDIAYVIYTSGSTGNPKGCILEHKGVINRIQWMWEEFKFTENDVILQKTTFTFDVSVWEIFMPLCWGAKMILCSEDDISDPQKIESLIFDNQVSCLHFVPSMLDVFINTLFETSDIKKNLKSLRLLIASGEALQLKTVKKWYEKLDTPIENLYGPTEASIDVTYHSTSKTDDFIPIGKPIWNTSIYILDHNKNIVPIGCSGEVYIAGVGLARGYLNNEKLTQERFIENPFIDGQKMYKTGDLGKWTPEGTIIYLGRNDNQLKIRGFRIELGEIEKNLLAYKPLDTTMVLAEKSPENEDYLIAFVVSDTELNSTEIKSFLKERLPDYMIPSRFVQLKSWPLTLNGKVDRKKLLASKESFSTDKVFAPPTTTTEKSLVAIWNALLGAIEIGLNDSFFELGGHSLIAIQLANRISKTFQVQISLKELFDYATLYKMAKLIDESSVKEYNEIPVSKSKISYPLSSAQLRLWFLSQFDDGNSAYNMPKAYVFEGDFNKEKLKDALLSLIARHEILRTLFKDNELGEINQFIVKPEVVGDIISYNDFRKETVAQDTIEELISKELNDPFDLINGPLLRSSLYQIEDSKWIFTFTMHHIISDGWSQQIFFNELIRLYVSEDEKEVNNHSTPLRTQYKDYAVWQQEELNGVSLKKHKEYWLNQFKGELSVVDFGDKLRPQIKTYNGAIISGKIDSSTSIGLKNLLQKEKCTLYMGLLSIVNVLIYKYTELEDIIIGSPIAGRNHLDAHNQLGIYINTLALRSKFNGNDVFNELLQHVKDVTLNAYEHQVYPFDEIVNDLDLQSNHSRNALFDIMVSLENTATILSDKEKQKSIENLKITEYAGKSEGVSKFDLSFGFVENEEEILFNLEYNTDIFSDELANGIAMHLTQLVENLVENPISKINEVHYLNEKEITKILQNSNEKITQDLGTDTVVSLFEKQVRINGNAIALVFNNIEVTYNDLDKKANLLANKLIRGGLKKEEKVVIFLDRSIETIVAILGVIKAAGAFVPIDIMTPKDRIAFILEDTQAKNILTIIKYKSSFFGFENVSIIDLKEDLKDFNTENINRNNTVVSINDLMYVIYTSGTTGVPKGVLIEHKGVVNLIKSQTKQFNITQEEVILNFSNYVFDASIEQLFLALLNGTKLVLPTTEDLLDYKKFEKILMNQRVTHLDVTPSYLSTITPNNYYLNRVVVGGETCPLELAERWDEKVPLFNAYGPTEATVTSIIHKYSRNQKAESRLPIGKPIENVSSYVLGEFLDLKGVNMIGELYLGGLGVARGYLNQEELTKEKFIKSPFNTNDVLYKTGDIVKWLPDGTIEYIGRIDDQIKIRGYRVELSEIEETIRKEDNIQSVSVLIKNSLNDEKEIMAFILANNEISTLNLKSRLKKFLPYYMIPDHIIQLKSFPQTTSGKVDKKKLVAISNDLTVLSSSELVKPKNELEEGILQIWKEILSKNEISVTDNFFEVGGHSLKAIKLQSTLKRELGLDLAIKDIYNAPTIRELSERKQINNSSLITLHNAGHSKTIYFIPPILGNSILFQPLAKHLGNEFNSFGLQYKGLEHQEAYHHSIEEMAQYFSKEIKKHHVDRTHKFTILGYSLGAVIAFEILKILEKEYDEIALVIVDRPTDISAQKTKKSINEEVNWLLIEYEKFVHINLEEKGRMKAFLKNNLKIDNQYRLNGEISNNIHILESIENEHSSAMMDWQNFTKGIINQHYIKGTHWDAFSEENFEKYLQILQSLYQNKQIKTI